jgi:hypothetical protein
MLIDETRRIIDKKANKKKVKWFDWIDTTTIR